MAADGFTLGLSLGNAAFLPEPEAEVAALLRKAADRIEAGVMDTVDTGNTVTIFDENGGRCGYMFYSDSSIVGGSA